MAEKFALSIERRLDVPPALLWQAWTDPERIRRWWCPPPYETVACAIELRPGGAFFTHMKGPGLDFAGTACILQAIPDQRIVWTSALQGDFAPNQFAADGSSGFPFTAIHSFDDDGAGGTNYTATVLHRDAADRDQHLAMGFEDGWTTCAEQMAEVARSLG